MRFPLPLPSISPSPTARGLALLGLTLAVLTLGGPCEDKHVGRICELGTPPGDMGVAIISSPALECPSRICLLPASDTGNPGNTGPLCTATCESNDDCSDGETGPKGNPDDHHCENGFVCMWPTTVGDFACQRLCVCRDFVSEPPGGFRKPPVCG